MVLQKLLLLMLDLLLIIDYIYKDLGYFFYFCLKFLIDFKRWCQERLVYIVMKFSKQRFLWLHFSSVKVQHQCLEVKYERFKTIKSKLEFGGVPFTLKVRIYMYMNIISPRQIYREIFAKMDRTSNIVPFKSTVLNVQITSILNYNYIPIKVQ